MAKKLIIAGHGFQKNGTFDPGASGYITKGEYKYMVENLFPSMKKYLPKNADVVFYTDKKVSNYGNLNQLVNQYKAKEVIEFHFDAHTLGSSAKGGHVIVHSRFSPDKLDLKLRDAIQKIVGVRYSHKGHKGISGRNNLYNVNVAANNGINYRLVELGFGTNKGDSNILMKQTDKLAKELVEAIFGNSSSNGSSPSKPSTKPPTKPNKKSNATIAKEVMAGKWGNNPKRKQDLEREGYDYSAIQSEVNKLAGGGSSKPKPKPKPKPKRSISKMADEVIAGKHGNGHANRQKSLGVSTAEYNKVKDEVNKRANVKTPSKPKPKKKTITQMAREVNQGKHGNGHANRQKSLGISTADYNKVRAEVNRIAGGGKPSPSAKPKKSVAQMAKEVLLGKHGYGHANRRKSLDISAAEYEKVRREVNKRA